MRRKLRLGAVATTLCVGAVVSTTAATPCQIAGTATVGGIGLAQLLGHWTGGTAYTPCPPMSVHDLNGDCRVNGLDLAMYLGAWGTSCQPIVTQLAGNPLASYPYFEYVRAFNQGAGFHLALDPSRFPAIVGRTCDIYVVNHKTAAQWASDPSLMDVTTGGFQTTTFTAGTIQSNTIQISGSAALNGTTGTQIGVGYDVVCDCNQNGLLDAGDFVDGTLSASAADEAGLYVVRDTAAPGPMAVSSEIYAVRGVLAGFEAEQIFYPTNIASLEPAPLVVVSHGNGHNYLWYDHIGTHLASFGYVVMSHQNATEGGVVTASNTTLDHTNALVRQVTTGPTIPALQPLVGRVDSGRIVLMGHSRGGEGVVIAYHRVLTGDYVPTSAWSADSIKLISSIAPTAFSTASTTNPHGMNMHVWVGAADGDVSGCSSSESAQSLHLHDRAQGYRQAITIHGAGHGDFHDAVGTSSIAAGPCQIGRERTHAIMLGYLLPLVERYVHGDIPATDFLWRQWEHFKPIGAPPTFSCMPPDGTGVDVAVNLMYREAPGAGGFMLDDFQTNPAVTLSSSGGAVSFSVLNVVEARLDDTDFDFTYNPAQPMNGMTLARISDDSAGVVFDWSAPAFYEQQIAFGHQDFRPFAYLSFRACQATRHPNTTAALEDLTLDVILRDASGHTSRINIGAYGGGIEEPYQRSGCGAGVGWANEFETIRIRLTDFLANGSGLDLSNITAVRLELGEPGASAVGKLGLDELQLTRD